MKKIIAGFVLIGFVLSACNIPLPTGPEGDLSPDDKAATIVAQTLSAVANDNSSVQPLASATEEPQPLASATGGSPAPTIQPNATPTAGTGTPGATLLTVDSNTNCREGPGTNYKVVIVLVPGTQYQMIARTQDNKYWIVTEIGKSTSCWVPAEFSNAFGNTSLLPVTTPAASTASASGSPATPTNLRYNFSCAFNADASYVIDVSLSWDDRSDNEQGFYVYRNGALIATLPAGSTTYSESFVGSASQINTYQVASFNAAGQALGGSQSFACTD